MHSIAIGKSSIRPALSIDTDLKKKKWNKSIFSSSKESIKSDQQSAADKTTYTQQLTESPIQSANSSRECLNTIADKIKSGHNHRVHSVQSVLKKLHKPHFHKRSFSTNFDLPKKAENCSYEPVAPEPVLPQLVNWSPQAPLSPPPWELSQEDHKHHRIERHSLKSYHTILSLSSVSDGYEEYDSITTLDSNTSKEYHSDSEIHHLSVATEELKLDDSKALFSPTDSIAHESDITLVGSTLSAGGSSSIRRRSSYPDILLIHSDSSTLAPENDIMSITEQHTRHMSVLKKYTHPADKKPALKSCQKAKARAAEAAANGTTLVQSKPFYYSFCEDMRYLYIPNVFHPVTRELVVEFSVIKPRKYQLHRKTSWKREAKALMTWHHCLEEKIQNPVIPEIHRSLSIDKHGKNELTRKFIMREFFDTEVNFWNQLYYSKVIFYDAVVSALSKGSQFIKEADVDMFGNLFDLMQFSAKLINRLRHFQMEHKEIDNPILQADINNIPNIDINNAYLGKAIRAMAPDFVVFLRCALDYKENRKTIDNNANNKGYLMYNQKLSLRKETSQFTIHDYLIIPIQRVARYGLLIGDLLKHSEPTHPDYGNLVISHQIVTSLAFAMNSVQKKSKA